MYVDKTYHMWLMVGQTSAKCDRRVWRVPVTLENAFFEKKIQRDPRDQRDPVTHKKSHRNKIDQQKHNVTHVTSVTL